METKQKLNIYSNKQLFILVVLRIAIGWHFLYEGIAKLFNSNWSSHGYLMDSKGFFSPLFYQLANSSEILNVVDFLNIWGLILIGLSLLIGLFVRFSAPAGMILLLIYTLSHPALLSVSYALPAEGNYLWIDKNIIEMLALCIIWFFPSSQLIGIDRLLQKKLS